MPFSHRRCLQRRNTFGVLPEERFYFLVFYREPRNREYRICQRYETVDTINVFRLDFIGRRTRMIIDCQVIARTLLRNPMLSFILGGYSYWLICPTIDTFSQIKDFFAARHLLFTPIIHKNTLLLPSFLPFLNRLCHFRNTDVSSSRQQ